MSQTPFMSIDFGTTNSVMAVFNQESGRPEVILNRDGNFATPSLAYYSDDDVVVGSRVQEMISDLAMLEESERVDLESRIVKSIKRDFREHEIISLPNGRDLEPVEIVTDILEKLKQEAEENHFHQPVSRVVLTHPATFDGVQTRLLESAARRAGFEEIKLLAEPESAALAYARCGQTVGDGVLVFDLGGGTFDLAVVKRNGDGHYHLAMEHDGDARCGGDDMDRALYDYWEEQIRREHGRGVALEDNEINLPFLMECRKRKENLSEHKTLPPFRSLLPGNQIVKLEADKASFEKLIEPLVQGMSDKTRRMVERANEQKVKVDTVVLIGGASQTPLVKERLKEVLPIEPRSWQLQHVAVALGAALYANDVWGGMDDHRMMSSMNTSKPDEKRKTDSESQPTTETLAADVLDSAERTTPQSIDRKLIVEVLRANFGPFPNTYCHPWIPHHKLSNTRQVYAPFIDQGDDILLVRDSTVFGGAKEGFVVTDSGIGWKKSMFEPPSFLTFAATHGGSHLPFVVGQHLTALVESIRQIEQRVAPPPSTLAPLAAIKRLLHRHFSDINHITFCGGTGRAWPEHQRLLRYAWSHDGLRWDFVLTESGIEFPCGSNNVSRRYDQIDPELLKISTSSQNGIAIEPTTHFPYRQLLLAHPSDKSRKHRLSLFYALKGFLEDLRNYDRGCKQTERAESTNGTCELTNNEAQAGICDQHGSELVYFGAPWCEPCRTVEPIIDELAVRYGKTVRFSKLNVDDHQQAASEFGIDRIPAMLMLNDGKVVNRLTGAQSEQQIEQLFAQLSTWESN